MNPLMIFRIALKALSRNKLRTGLTMLGMIIGVAAVITMVAIGSGAQAQIEEQIRGNGTNLITVFPGGTQGPGGVSQGMGTFSRLTEDDAKALRLLPEVEFVSEVVNSRQQVIYGNQNWQTQIVGAGVDYPLIRSWPLKYGSFFTEADVTSTAKVCVLGSNVATNLFGENVDPTGVEVRVRNQIFRVLGVMASKGAQAGGMNQDDQVLAPYTTVMKRLQGVEFLNQVLVSAKSADALAQTSQAVTAELRQTHKIENGAEDDFRLLSQDDIVALRTQTTETMTALMAGIAGVSLVVGGIGIMNIMLVSVTERTREIGLRLAIGARGADVLKQFLVEAIVISLLGGAIGVMTGWGASEFFRIYQQMPTLVPLNAILASVGFSAAVGIFFGFYPAFKASSLDPITALKFE